MREDFSGGDWPSDDNDDFDLAAVLDYPRALLVAAAPGGLARFVRAVEAVRAD